MHLREVFAADIRPIVVLSGHVAGGESGELPRIDGWR